MKTREDYYVPLAKPSVVDALLAIADAIRYAADRLSTGNAATKMGGMEIIAKEIKEGLRDIAVEMHERE